MRTDGRTDGRTNDRTDTHKFVVTDTHTEVERTPEIQGLLKAHPSYLMGILSDHELLDLRGPHCHDNDPDSDDDKD